MNRNLLLSIPVIFILSLYTVSCGLFSHEHITDITAVDLGVLPGGQNSTARDINDNGVIVGGSDTSAAGDRRAFIIDAQGMHNLGTLAGAGDSIAYGVSNNGYIVGYATVRENVTHGFVVQNNTMRDLGAYPPEDDIGSRSKAYAVNSAGLIAGRVDDVGVVWDLNGTPKFPPFPPFTAVTAPGPFEPAIAYAINENDQVAGYMPIREHAFRWQSGHLEILKAYGIKDFAFGINKDGRAVGQSLMPASAAYHAVYWPQPDFILDLGTLHGQTSVAEDINADATIVGYSETASGETHAFIWRWTLGMRSLGTLGGRNSKAFAINSNGVIVGESETATGEVHATRWVVSIEER